MMAYQRTHGFRFSLLDGLVLLIATGLGAWGMAQGKMAAFFIIYVILHFFLFCNVFRVRRKPELIWAVTFLINCAIWIAFGDLNIVWICTTQLFITLGVILHGVKDKSYHGIFAKRWNTHLESYLKGET